MEFYSQLFSQEIEPRSVPNQESRIIFSVEHKNIFSCYFTNAVAVASVVVVDVLVVDAANVVDVNSEHFQ